MSDRLRIVAAVLLAGLAWYLHSPAAPPDTPPGELVLDGLFVGPTASQDAGIVSAMTGELADEIEYDGQQSQPSLKTGVQLDYLRTRARDLRCRGDSIGDRQPQVREAVKNYLDSKLGTSGGPITQEMRDEWVKAYRVVSKSAYYAAR